MNVPPELAGLAEAEEFFEALGVPYDDAVLAAHRLHIMKLFGLAAEAWLDANPGADTAGRRAALSRALREAHAKLVEDPLAAACGLLAARPLVRLKRPCAQ